jgi:hypothetical protein
MVICLQQIHLIIALQTLNHQPLVANEGQCHSLSLSWLLNIACAEQELHTTQEIHNSEAIIAFISAHQHNQRHLRSIPWPFRPFNKSFSIACPTCPMKLEFYISSG